MDNSPHLGESSVLQGFALSVKGKGNGLPLAFHTDTGTNEGRGARQVFFLKEGGGQ